MQQNLYDKENMLGAINSLPEQIKNAYMLGDKIKITGTVDRIIVCGMGGSSISGQLLDTYFRLEKIPIQIVNVEDYSIPAYADKNSVLFIISYSGNTEESISCHKEALRRGLNQIILTTGGELAESAKNKRLPLVIVPSGFQPRNAVAYLFFPLIKILESNGIISSIDKIVKNYVEVLKKNMPHLDKIAYDVAKKLHGKTPIIYSSDVFYSVAYRWKCEVNENTKIPSYCSKLPELNHNELNGYVNYNKVNIPLHIIILKDESDHVRIKKRMDITRKLIKEMTDNKIEFTEIGIKGDNSIAKIFTTIYIGDLVSFYLAMLYGTDPSPVDIIEKFKKLMGPTI